MDLTVEGMAGTPQWRHAPQRRLHQPPVVVRLAPAGRTA